MPLELKSGSNLRENVATRSVWSDEPLLVTQKVTAKLLGVSRVTVWRLTKECVLHPIEILPGTWRYSWQEVTELAKSGWRGITRSAAEVPHAMSA